MEKSEVRSLLKQQRMELPQHDVEVFSKGIAKKIVSLEAFQEVRQIYCYLPILNEVDTEELIDMCYYMHKKVAVPKVVGDSMEFYNLTAKSSLQMSKFHVLEPVNGEKPDETVLGLMLVPGVAFDKRGYRIGYGKGYYDRYLKNKDHLITVGMAYDFQVKDEICEGEYDVPLHTIVTQKSIYYCK